MARRSHPTAKQVHGQFFDRDWMEANVRRPVAESDNRPPPAADDCAVVAAVLRDYYELTGQELDPPFLVLADEGWPSCDWARWGLRFRPGPLPPRDAPRAERMYKSISFGRPAYDSGGAIILTSISFGPNMGYGSYCRVRQDEMGWYLDGATLRSIC